VYIVLLLWFVQAHGLTIVYSIAYSAKWGGAGPWAYLLTAPNARRFSFIVFTLVGKTHSFIHEFSCLRRTFSFLFNLNHDLALQCCCTTAVLCIHMTHIIITFMLYPTWGWNSHINVHSSTTFTLKK